MVPTHINDMEPLSNNASTLKMEEMIKTVLHKLNGKIDSSEARLEYMVGFILKVGLVWLD